MADNISDQISQNSQAEELAKARHVVTTGRDLAEYEKRLQIKREDLAGKIILDLGSGVAKFPLELAEFYGASENKPHIFALDIAYDFQTHGAGKALLSERIYQMLEKFPDTITAVTGLFSELPFKRDSFDYVFSLYAFPLHIKGEQFFEQGLSEIIRVLKAGGQAKMAPLEYNSGRIENGKEKYLAYHYNREHFQDILKHVEHHHPGTHFQIIENQHHAILEITKSY